MFGKGFREQEPGAIGFIPLDIRASAEPAGCNGCGDAAGDAGGWGENRAGAGIAGSTRHLGDKAQRCRAGARQHQPGLHDIARAIRAGENRAGRDACRAGRLDGRQALCRRRRFAGDGRLHFRAVPVEKIIVAGQNEALAHRIIESAVQFVQVAGKHLRDRVEIIAGQGGIRPADAGIEPADHLGGDVLKGRCRPHQRISCQKRSYFSAKTREPSRA